MAGSTWNGAYRLEASAADLTRDVESLMFVPTRHEVAPGKTVTTSFTISDDFDDTEIASVVVTGTRYPNVPEIVGPATGHGLLDGTGSDDQIIASGLGNVILTNGGRDYVDAGAGGAVVLGGGGDKMIALGGALNIVRAGDGDDVVSGAPGGLTSVTLGNGNDSVTLGGSLDHVVLGNGNDTVCLTGGMSFVSVGSGTDMLTVSGADNEITLGLGVDTVVATGRNDAFVLPKIFHGASEILGFSVTNGDKLDLRPALAGLHWNGSIVDARPLYPGQRLRSEYRFGHNAAQRRDGHQQRLSRPGPRAAVRRSAACLAHHSLIV